MSEKMKSFITFENFFKLLLVAILTITVFNPEISFAASSPFDVVDDKGDSVVSWVTDKLVVWLGIVAIVGVAVGMFYGKINWLTAATVIGAIIIALNAPSIIAALK